MDELKRMKKIQKELARSYRRAMERERFEPAKELKQRLDELTKKIQEVEGDNSSDFDKWATDLYQISTEQGGNERAWRDEVSPRRQYNTMASSTGWSNSSSERYVGCD